MKWYKKNYKNGEFRIKRKKFLIFPKRIGNEYRWLECASIVQRYHQSQHPYYDSSGWEDYGFIPASEKDIELGTTPLMKNALQRNWRKNS